MTVKNIEPLTIRPDAFCLPPETGCEILNVLNEINEDYKTEFNKNNCKAKETLAGFAQAFTVMATQALSHIGEFFVFEKDANVNDRVKNNPSQNPLIIKLKKLKIDPFLCEKIAYYQEKIAPIRNRVLFNEHGEAWDIWGSFSEDNESSNSLNFIFPKAVAFGDIQIIQIVLASDLITYPDYLHSLCLAGGENHYLKTFRAFLYSNHNKKQFFNDLSYYDLSQVLVRASEEGDSEIIQEILHSDQFKKIANCELDRALIKSSEKGHSKIFQAFIDSGRFKDISTEYLSWAFSLASSWGHLEIVRGFINSGRFNDISVHSIDEALKEASKFEHLVVIKAIKATDHFKQLLKEFPEKFNKFL
jgi:hypothetical protein